MKSILKKVIVRLLRFCNSILPKEQYSIMLIPHGGATIDGNSIINYKSDNVLCFLRWLIAHYPTRHTYYLAVQDDFVITWQREANEYFPQEKIRCFSYFASSGKTRKFKTVWTEFVILSKCKNIFTARIQNLSFKSKNQCLIYLGYYSMNFKNDYIPMYRSQTYVNSIYDYLISSSSLFSYINSNVYNVPLFKFKEFGMLRNEELVKPYCCNALDAWIKKQVAYDFKYVFLYVPTHRDYEENSTSSAMRTIFGFDLDSERISEFLKVHKCIIICKLHSHQNVTVLKKSLPEGIYLHESNSFYGLCELMQRATHLINDYSSAYFDYLWMDRPVIFNFSDEEIYRKTRGFAINPIESLMAGEVFHNQEEFLNCLDIVLKSDNFKEKRHFVKHLVTNGDNKNIGQKIYDLVLS